MNFKLLLPLLAAGLIIPWAVPPFFVTLANFIGLSTIVTVGLIMLTGVAGLTSLAQASFAGVAAYATAYLTTKFDVSPWLTLLIGLAATGLVALVIGALTLRLSGHFLPVGTIAWSISLYYLFVNIEDLGGNNGITNVPKLTLLGFHIGDSDDLFYLIWIVVVLAILSLKFLLDSRMGRAIRSLRGGTVMIEAFGANTAKLKMWIFLYAALLAGVSGWMYAHFVQFVSPTAFSLNVSIEYFFMAIIGGAGSPVGALVGASVFVAIKQVLQDILPAMIGRAGEFEIIFFGILVVLLLHYARRGIVPLVARLWRSAPVRMPDVHLRRSPQALPERPAPSRGSALLEVEGLTKLFGGLTAVNGVSFTLAAGEIVGLIGPNGAGKSTMFNLISGVLPANGGAVRFQGQRIDGRPSREIARLGVARSFQHAILRPGMSVLENVAIGAHLRGRRGIVPSLLRLDRRDEAALLAEAARQLERVGLAGCAHLDASKLPLGQQRIVEIARALAADPILLLLDEPAAGLRLHEKEDLARLIRDIRDEGIAILLVEHDMNFVMNLVDRLVVMDFGERIAQGTPEAVRTDPAVIAAYLGTEA